MWFTTRRSTARRSVLQDWAAALPREKLHLYDATVRRWELSYAMMSVALDDAFTMRSCGKVVFASQQLTIAGDLLHRFSQLMISSFDSLVTCGRRSHDFPAVEPLHTEFFRGSTGQWAASWSGLVHHILLGDRPRFFHKLRSLSSMIEKLQSEFDAVSEQIARGGNPEQSTWLTIDYLHYDFNTCLREAEVVLKSFLRNLPPEETERLAGNLDPLAAHEEPAMPPRLAQFPDMLLP
jgi:hypothetical protein